jgi:RNA recognition motif-containing protein
MARLWVGNVPYNATQAELEAEFLPFGPIANMSFREGFSFVEFEADDDAKAAKDKLHDTDFQGRRLQVEYARAVGDRGPPPDRGDRDGPSRGSAGAGSRHLYVARIPEAVTPDELHDFFAKHGNGARAWPHGTAAVARAVALPGCAG